MDEEYYDYIDQKLDGIIGDNSTEFGDEDYSRSTAARLKKKKDQQLENDDLKPSFWQRIKKAFTFVITKVKQLLKIGDVDRSVKPLGKINLEKMNEYVEQDEQNEENEQNEEISKQKESLPVWFEDQKFTRNDLLNHYEKYLNKTLGNICHGEFHVEKGKNDILNISFKSFEGEDRNFVTSIDSKNLSLTKESKTNDTTNLLILDGYHKIINEAGLNNKMFKQVLDDHYTPQNNKINKILEDVSKLEQGHNKNVYMFENSVKYKISKIDKDTILVRGTMDDVGDKKTILNSKISLEEFTKEKLKEILTNTSKEASKMRSDTFIEAVEVKDALLLAKYLKENTSNLYKDETTFSCDPDDKNKIIMEYTNSDDGYKYVYDINAKDGSISIDRDKTFGESNKIENQSQNEMHEAIIKNLHTKYRAEIYGYKNEKFITQEMLNCEMLKNKDNEPLNKKEAINNLLVSLNEDPKNILGQYSGPFKYSINKDITKDLEVTLDEVGKRKKENEINEENSCKGIDNNITPNDGYEGI